MGTPTAPTMSLAFAIAPCQAAYEVEEISEIHEPRTVAAIAKLAAYASASNSSILAPERMLEEMAIVV